MHRALLSGEFLDGPRAFAEKREPVFKNAWPDPFAQSPTELSPPDRRRS